ncbi:hypothetical protein DC522_12555 [Microvirga sp. KLBC 81]|uniref:hypothetical protein n=1 Tax=Microvirga sp. KLBC 81 TaxID=1862707 RepID=UPI000D50BC5D|nr:hypothetical protein [Microvirga sp. KLBC 81]PVE24114.1 hypothetical protein DC522_12555 [Microvirga sp. KLBC 81]
MWFRRNQERALRSLLSRIEAASEPTNNLVAEVLQQACPRLQAAPKPNDLVRRLIAAEAWVDLGFWLIGWELPDWVIHRLSCDDRRWTCSICVRGLAINWIEDVAEFQHDNPSLAILGALVQAQLRKIQGPVPSNVTPFRRTGRRGTNRVSNDAER